MSINKCSIDNAIFDYIEYPDTKYAVLLNASWGTGKTYYWKNELEKKIKEKGYNTIYVSLNGLDNTDQVARKIVMTYLKNKTGNKVNIEPVLKHKKLLSDGFSVIGSILNTCKEITDISTSIVKIDLKPENMIDMIKLDKTVICFDDLDRCAISTKMLGFINDFVEHKVTKVIILANEDKIQEDISKIKEKVIGKTINFEISKKEILTNIINSYPPEILEFFLSEIELIIEMMNCNNSCNYRVICTILDDFYNIYKKRDSFDEQSFLKAQNLLLKYALAVGLEIRVDGIGIEEKKQLEESNENIYIHWKLKNKLNKRLNKKKGVEKKVCEPYSILFRKKYYENDWQNKYLFPSVLTYLNTGYFDCDRFRAELSSYQEKDFTALEYILYIGYWEMSDKEFEQKVKIDLLKQIEKGEVELSLYSVLFSFYALCLEKKMISCSIIELVNIFRKGLNIINNWENYDLNNKENPYNKMNFNELLSSELINEYKKIRDFENEIRLNLADKNYKHTSERFTELLRKDMNEAIELVYNNEIEGFNFNKAPLFQGTSIEDIHKILKQNSNHDIMKFTNFIINRYELKNYDFDIDYHFLNKFSSHILNEISEGELTLSGHLLKKLAENIKERCCNRKNMESIDKI